MYSEVHALGFAHERPTTAIGIKYVLSGEERYTCHKKTSTVRNGSYLLLNAGQTFDLEIKSAGQPVTGMCIYLNQQLLNEAALYHDAEIFSGDDQNKTLYYPELFEHVYDPSDPLAVYLKTIIHQIRSGTVITDETLFFGVATQLFFSQGMARKEMTRLKAMKLATKKELYKRLHQAREILTDPQSYTLPMKTVAASVSLSQYHFYRSFRQLFGISPHRFHSIQKLSLAREKLLHADATITGVALSVGYPDIQSFSKAFKKQFGMTPGNFRST